MRWILNTFRARMLASLRHSPSWAFILMAILCSLVPMGVAGNPDPDPRIPVAVVVEDQGDQHKELLSLFGDSKTLKVSIMDRRTAMSLLEKDRLEAVYVLKPNFSRELDQGRFDNIIELYASPSSMASATLSEPLINDTLMLWIEEVAVQRTEAFLKKQGASFSAEDAMKQRRDIEKVWAAGTPIVIQEYYLEQGTDRPVVTALPAASATLWYGAFIVFYFIVGAGWILDIRKTGISERLKQVGASLWQVLAGASLVPLVLGLAGWGILLLFSGKDLWNAGISPVGTVLTMVLYMLGVLGLTMTAASLVRHGMTLMILAPFLTFINAVLGGLLVVVPQWATFLETVSLFLPGRWLNLSLGAMVAGEHLPVTGLLLCSGAWLGAGFVLSILSAGPKGWANT